MAIDIICNFECVASYPGSSGPGSVKYLTCPVPGMCLDCPKRFKFYELVCDYMNKGDTRTVALWKARQVNKIPTEYDITGEVRSWRQAFKPDTVAEVEAQERAFLGEAAEDRRPDTDPEQITVCEVMENGGV